MAVTKNLGLDWNKAWYQLRGHGATLVTADDVDPHGLASSEGDWANKPAAPAFNPVTQTWNCIPQCAVQIPEVSGGGIQTIEIIGYGTTADDQNCAWVLYAYRGQYSPAIRVAAGTAILSSMDVVTDPVTNAAITGFYVDTFGGTADYWGAVAYKDDADNACSRMMFDIRGYQYLYMEVLPTSGTCTSIGFAFSGC